MERRAFLNLLWIGTGASLFAKPAEALTAAATAWSAPPALGQQPSVATPKDIDKAEIEDVYYGHWRRVNRRVSRRVYRRHYYY